MTTVTLTLREHLIMFFFKESEGKEFRYGKTRVKGIQYSAYAGSIGTIIRLLLEKANIPQYVENYNLNIVINEHNDYRKYSTKFYKQIDGQNSFLKLPEEVNRDINNLFEDIFRMAFIAFVDGFVAAESGTIVKAIDIWIDRYDLLEFGFSNSTFRRQYYREKDKKPIAGRFQKNMNSSRLNSNTSGVTAKQNKLF